MGVTFFLFFFHCCYCFAFWPPVPPGAHVHVSSFGVKFAAHLWDRMDNAAATVFFTWALF